MEPILKFHFYLTLCLIIDKVNSQLVWTRYSGGTAIDESKGVACDSSGNIYVVGLTSGNFNGILNSGGNDAFIVKYSSSGDRLWTRLMGTAGNDEARGIAISASGFIYVTGHTTGNLNVTNLGFNNYFFLALAE